MYEHDVEIHIYEQSKKVVTASQRHVHVEIPIFTN